MKPYLIIAFLLSVCNHASYANSNFNSIGEPSSQPQEERIDRFCQVEAKDKLPRKIYGLSMVFYGNRSDFRKSGTLHKRVFDGTGVTQVLNIPIDAPFDFPRNGKESIVNLMRQLNDKILSESKGFSPVLKVLISSHGNSRIIGRQNQHSSLLSKSELNRLTSEAGRLAEELKKAEKDGNFEYIKQLRFELLSISWTKSLANGGNDESYTIYDEPNIPWQNMLDALYDSFDSKIKLDFMVETCHSGELIKTLAHPTNQVWKARDALFISSNSPDLLGLGNIFLENFLEAKKQLKAKPLNRCEMAHVLNRISYKAVKPDVFSDSFTETIANLTSFSLGKFSVNDHPHVFYSKDLATEPRIYSQPLSTLDEFVEPAIRRNAYKAKNIPAKSWLIELGKTVGSLVKGGQKGNFFDSNGPKNISKLEALRYKLQKDSLGSWGHFMQGYYSIPRTFEKNSPEKVIDFEIQFVLPHLGPLKETIVSRLTAGIHSWKKLFGNQWDGQMVTKILFEPLLLTFELPLESPTTPPTLTTELEGYSHLGKAYIRYLSILDITPVTHEKAIEDRVNFSSLLVKEKSKIFSRIHGIEGLIETLIEDALNEERTNPTKPDSNDPLAFLESPNPPLVDFLHNTYRENLNSVRRLLDKN